MSSDVFSSAKRAGVTIVDLSSSIMECNDCGRRWGAMLKSGGNYVRGWRRCPNGCNEDKLSNDKRQ